MVVTIRLTELCLNIVTHAQKAICLLAAGIVPPKQWRRILKSTEMKVHFILKAGHGGLEGNEAADEDPRQLAYRALV